jgi:DNA-binding NtrC family response regulator
MASAVNPVPFALPTPPSPVRSVLLVDEVPNDLHAYADILNRQGYQVHTCESVREGECFLRDGSFDLVIVSQGSRGFRWRSLVQRAIGMDRRRPVLVVTDCVDMRSYLDAMWLGATDYLERPRSPEQFLRTVRMFLPGVASEHHVVRP